MGIRKLARSLDLSIGTVSRALNDRPDVSPDTRARVKAAAAASGYVPNQSGRSLRKGSTDMVAAVIPSTDLAQHVETPVMRVLEGARRTLRAEGVDLVVLFRGPEEEALVNLRRIVSRRIADGIIIGQTCAEDPRIDFLIEAGVRFAVFGRSAGREGYCWADIDIAAAAAEAVRVFVAAGHRRLALALNEHPLNFNDVLRAAFVTEALRLGLPPEAVQVLPTRRALLTPEGHAAIADPATAPTAFLAGDEGIASALYADLARLGRPVGFSTAVISALPALHPAAHDPALTAFDADFEGIGEALAHRLLAAGPGAADAPEPAAAPMRLARRASHIATAGPTA